MELYQGDGSSEQRSDVQNEGSRSQMVSNYLEQGSSLLKKSSGTNDSASESLPSLEIVAKQTTGDTFTTQKPLEKEPVAKIPFDKRPFLKNPILKQPIRKPIEKEPVSQQDQIKDALNQHAQLYAARNLQENFDQIDTDNNGKLSKEELQEQSKNGESFKDRRYASFALENYNDFKNQTNKRIFRHEIVKEDLGAKIRRQEMADRHVVNSHFSDIDTNNDGYIESEELGKYKADNIYDSLAIQRVKGDFDKVINRSDDELGEETVITKEDVSTKAILFGYSPVRQAVTQHLDSTTTKGLAERFKEIDTDKDGTLSKTELAAEAQNADTIQDRSTARYALKNYERISRFFKNSKSDRITYLDLAVNNARQSRNDRLDLNQRFSYVDQNNDGKISEQELTDYGRNARTLEDKLTASRLRENFDSISNRNNDEKGEETEITKYDLLDRKRRFRLRRMARRLRRS